MEMRKDLVGSVTVLAVTGRLDSTTAPTFGEQLLSVLNALQCHVVLDLRQLEYISSAGFRVLLVAAKRAEKNESRLVLCGVSGKVRQLFELGGFLDLFAISASREDAIAAAG